MKKFKLTIPLLTYAIVTICGLAAHAWELSDVSVLLPMPKTMRETSQLLMLKSAGSMGQLTPDSIVAQLPKLVHNRDQAQTYKTDLRAVGFRFDPCFSEGPGTPVCRRQVRIIWQPIVEQKSLPVTLDAPVHTFYEFNEAKWNSLLDAYAKLIGANPLVNSEFKLVVNPRAAKQGYGGTFMTGLSKLILDNCGSNNLVRLTLMSLHPGDNEWHFMGFNIEAGKMLPIAIANIGATVQILKTDKPLGFDLRATVQPDGNSKTASAIYKDSLGAKAKMTEGEMQNFADELLTIENPLRSNPGTVDCAGCHMAGPGAQWARLNFPQWEWQNLAIRSGWVTKRDVTNTTLKFLRPRRFRAFGFFYTDSVISQRTINESAVVADALDQSHPLKK